MKVWFGQCCHLVLARNCVYTCQNVLVYSKVHAFWLSMIYQSWIYHGALGAHAPGLFTKRSTPQKHLKGGKRKNKRRSPPSPALSALDCRGLPKCLSLAPHPPRTSFSLAIKRIIKMLSYKSMWMSSKMIRIFYRTKTLHSFSLVWRVLKNFLQD